MNERFDTSTGGARELVLILSTPRSGSTFLCDQLRMRAGFVPHEYFEPKYCLPYLAARWDCLDDGELNVRRYAQSLRRHRVGRSGRLGINVQGSQLPLFGEFFDQFEDLAIRVIRVRRGDRLGQAISFAIAEQTRGWSRHFAKTGQPTYNYEHIARKVDDLAKQELVIDAFLNKHGLESVAVQYEELVSDPTPIISGALGEAIVPEVGEAALIAKQRGTVNDEWRERYEAESLTLTERYARQTEPASVPRRLVSRARRELRRALRSSGGRRR
ncbi:Stf0 family sulfotransferase [Georgenia deserti]|uniref:Stf0 family sulfotransferase n=1 Tax=Georgenia deserti TaxID=2093781 RepID=A0ABW4L2L8_9MICO